jgi:hypothetical protein
VARSIQDLVGAALVRTSEESNDKRVNVIFVMLEKYLIRISKE